MFSRDTDELSLEDLLYKANQIRASNTRDKKPYTMREMQKLCEVGDLENKIMYKAEDAMVFKV